MAIDDKLKMKDYNTILTYRLQKCQQYHEIKLKNINIFHMKQITSNQKQIIERSKFTYSLLGKAFEKQAKTIKDQEDKIVNVLKSLTFFQKQLPLTIDFVSKERVNLEIMSEPEKL